VAGDTIDDFLSGTDKIQIVRAAFGGLPAGALNPANFATIGAAYDGTNSGHAGGSPVFVFSTADQTLYFDDNTATPGYTVLVEIQPGGTLVASDVQLV
jgi:hypothetical protein